MFRIYKEFYKPAGYSGLKPVIPALWEAQVGRSPEDGSLRPDQHGETLSLLKIQISWAWGCMPIISTTLEAEAGELLELGRWRLQ